LKGNSFGGQKRMDMLLNWAKVLNCKWLRHEHLVNLVQDKIVNEEKLPTCLNIEQFSYATIGVESEQQLLETVEAKSIETARYGMFNRYEKPLSPQCIYYLSMSIFFYWHSANCRQ
jgi:hypothetical protein